MLKRLKDFSLRRLLGLPAFIIALGLCIWATVERGLFDGATLLIASCGLLLGLLRMLPSRPKLEVTVRDRDKTCLVVTQTKPVRPLDEHAIVEEQVDIALKSMPRRPMPNFPPGSPFEKVTAIYGSDPLAAISGVSDEELRKFEEEVREYAAKLRDWITRLELVRGERLRLFKGELRIRELGHAPADHVHLRLHFPEDFALNEDLPVAGPLPKRPEFNRGVVFPRLPLIDPADLADITSIRLPGSDKPQYSMEDGTPIVDYDLGRVNQSDHRDVPAFCLRAPRPGSYVVKWAASAQGLGKLAQGSFVIEVEEPSPGQPILSLSEADAERGAYEFH